MTGERPDVEGARQKAAELLKKANVPGAPIDVHQLAEFAGVHVLFQEMDSDISGMLVHDTDGTMIAVNANHHVNRQRFTIAHELGHHALHAGHPTVFVDNMMVHFRAESLHGPHVRTEIEANAFAAELLMPESLLRQDLSTQDIDVFDDGSLRTYAQRYQVSLQALTIRLSKLGLIQGVPDER